MEGGREGGRGVRSSKGSRSACDDKGGLGCRSGCLDVEDACWNLSSITASREVPLMPPEAPIH